MFFLGGIMVLAGLGLSLPLLSNAMFPPTVTEAGAVVVAVTAQPTDAASASPTTSIPLRFAPGTAAAEEQAHRPSSQLPASRGAEPQQTPAPRPTLTPFPTPAPTLAPPPTPTLQPSEPPTRIVAPAINLDAQVVPMTWEMVKHGNQMVPEWVVPENEAGWHVNSAPAGQIGNTVLSGHHNIYAKVFRYVVDLEPGDEITLYAGDEAYVYTVTEKYILKEAGMPPEVRQKNAQWIAPTGDERLTLVTCWPYQWPGNTHRVVVVARPATGPG